MKLKRFYTALFLIVFVSILYVYEQASIIRLSYAYDKKQYMLSDLHNQNKQYAYKLAKLENKLTIENLKMTETKQYEFPTSTNMGIILAQEINAQNMHAKKPSTKKPFLLSKIFGIIDVKNVAIAKTAE